MINSERMTTFLNSFYKPLTPFLEDLAEEAAGNGVPIIRKDVRNFIRVFLQEKKPEAILEIGTAVGFSAILMAQYTPDQTRITTVEDWEPRIPLARENFRRSGFSDRITLIQGDGGQIMKELDGPFDFIFMDAAKGQYLTFLPEVTRLLQKGGVLISDNCLQDGDLLESHYIVERRNRTIYKRMREYLYTLTHSDDFETAILPIGDGLTVSVRL